MNSTPWEKAKTFLLSPASDRKAWAALALGLSVLALFAPVLFSSHRLISTPEGDLANQFLGWRAFGFSELKRGHLALWNPYIFCGAPYFAGFQSALLYPLNWTFLFLPLVFALNFSFVLHVFLAGFFTYLWLASHRLSFLSALFGSFVFMFGGAFFAHVYPGHLPNLCAMAWIPLVFLSVEKILAEPGLRSALFGAGVLSLQLLAGHPQYFLYTLLFAVLYSLALLAQDPSEWIKKLCWGLGAGALAAALTAVQWLPGLEAAKEFGRISTSDPETMQWFSMDPYSLLWVLAPGADYGKSFPDRYWLSPIWWETCLFIGIGAFYWALTSLFNKGLSRQERWLPPALAILAILLAMGPRTPLYPFLTKLPLFGSFRGSFKFDILFQVFIVLLSAKGLQYSLSRTEPHKVSSKLITGITLTLIGISFFPLAYNFCDDPERFGIEIADRDLIKNWFLCLAWTTLLFLVYGWGAISKYRWVRFPLVLFAIVQLFYFAAKNLESFEVEELLQNHARIREGIRGNLGDGRIYWEAHNDQALLLGTPSIWGDDPLVSKRYELFLYYHKNAVEKPKYNMDLLQLTPVKMELTRLAYLMKWRYKKDAQITANPAPRLARFNLIGQTLQVKDLGGALESLETPGFDPAKQVILEEIPNPAPVENKGKGQVSVKIHSTDRFEFNIQLEKPQVLLMTDTYATGWKARPYPESIQKDLQVLPADVFARGIPLSAGNHHFDLVYDPPGFAVGKLISLAALPLYLLALWLAGRRRDA